MRVGVRDVHGVTSEYKQGPLEFQELTFAHEGYHVSVRIATTMEPEELKATLAQLADALIASPVG